jgi:hypothetical protein
MVPFSAKLNTPSASLSARLVAHQLLNLLHRYSLRHEIGIRALEHVLRAGALEAGRNVAALAITLPKLVESPAQYHQLLGSIIWQLLGNFYWGYSITTTYYAIANR